MYGINVPVNPFIFLKLHSKILKIDKKVICCFDFQCEIEINCRQIIVIRERP